MIKEYNLEEKIDMYGFVENPYPILKNSKIMMMTSVYEGTPMAALEAQALGKVIISTPVDGLKKIIINGYNGYLSDKDEELVRYTLNLLENNNYQILTNNVIKNFDEYNNIIQYYSCIIKLYE